MNCIESKLSSLFHRHGRLLGKYPLPYVLWPIILTAILAAGMTYLKDDSDRATIYTPEHGPAKLHRDIVKDLFPMNDDGEFLPSRIVSEGRNGRLIIMGKNWRGNVLHEDVLDEVRQLHAEILNLTVTINDESVSIRGHLRSMARQFKPWYERVHLTYPFAPSPTGYPAFIGNSLGGVGIMGDNVVKSAKAIQLFYYLLNKSLERLVPRFVVTCCAVVLFSIMCCSSFDCVVSKPWLGLLGVLTASMAILSAVGLLGFCKVDFISAVASMPFLILGIGVDNMFIMVAAWRRTPSYLPVEDRMAQTFREAAMSITITSVTDVLAFCVGAISDFPGVRIFCLYTGLAIIFGYIYQITFFGACLSEFGRLEAKNGHWATCQRVLAPDEAPSSLYRVFCAGGISESNPKGSTPEHIVAKFFGDYYGPFLTKSWVKGLVALTFLIYLAFSIWGCIKIQRGIKLKNTVPDDSYASKFLTLEEEYYSQYGLPVSVIVYRHAEYWDKQVQNEISRTLQEIENTQYFHDSRFTQSWLHDYLNYLNQTGRRSDVMGQETFIDVLQEEFLNIQAFQRHKADIRFANGAILATRFSVLTENADDANKQREMMEKVRSIAEDSPIPMIAFHPAFIFYDQYTEILPSTLQTMGIAAASMLLVSLLLIPHPICSLWVTFSVFSISVGVIGFMTHWDISLDAISMINIIICIGFSVDFSAHITYSFVVSPAATNNERAISSLRALGMPILQGAISSILGVVALCTAEAYTFRTFFKTNFLAIGFGALFALVFLPTFLTFFGPKVQEKDIPKDVKQAVKLAKEPIVSVKNPEAPHCEYIVYLPPVTVV
uniref:Patched domain-containing protein 3-like n=1 Tax=Saccoglossus kowalevskii TaxID=10224 RepID=A0ABM0MKX7_SACKO|nr:PREDICTED: patched domain-containing protein 3-like [Saccoglossus kowalevskii]